MGTAEMNYIEDHAAAETLSDQLHSPDSPCRNGIYDEPLIRPHMGDEYQVQIPELATQSCLISTRKMLTVDYHVGVGSAIPIMWMHHVGDATEDEQKEFSCSDISSIKGGSVVHTNTGKGHADPVYKTMSQFPAESSSGCSTYLLSLACTDECTDLANCCRSDGSTITKSTTLENKIHSGAPLLQLNEAKGYNPFPGMPSSSWSEDESQSFLLGLYIFGKNLVQVKNFVGCKKMGDILSYYYGKFYRSDAYRRLSECRKVRSRRCILGHRIFTGWRQQEILSRVLPKIPKEVQDSLLEAANIFNEDRTSLEEFVCTLKTTVGMQALVEAIGIGKEKSDLTGIILDPVRSNQSLSSRPEIPVGKACSSLTSADIIKFLTGDFRLSKAKSNDLFWEAVWPRLLARGWHSEQPKDINSVASKHSLVFLIPGVKKFSRKKLLKGNHYFDSVSDVLSKVASDPRLLELDTEGATGSSTAQDENERAPSTNLDQNGLLGRKHHCYLRPKVPICNSEFMKFTIVDTSLVQGEGPFKVRELKTLPTDAIRNLGPLTDTGVMVSDSSEDSNGSSSNERGDTDPDSSDNKKPNVSRKCIIGKAVHSDSRDNVITFASTKLPTNGHILMNQCIEQLNEKLPVKDIKCQFSSRAKSGEQSCLAPNAKRRKLTACKYERTGHRAYSFSKSHQLMREGAEPELEAQEASGNTVAQRKNSSNFPINISPDEADSKCDSEEQSCCDAATFDVSSEMPRSRTLIDLNLLPNVPLDYETGEHSNSEVGGGQHDLNLEEAVKLSEGKEQHDGSGAMENLVGAIGDQQPSVNTRRHSTRSRPPTTKALEALACGFLGNRRRGRDSRDILSGNMPNKSSHRVSKTVEANPQTPSTRINGSEYGLSNGTVDDWHSGNTHHIGAPLSDSCVQPEGNRTHELLGIP
ncbi:hypothetical protein MUK42_20187 [Musa troglodytarum]|uniref:SANT domain-containing protein n=1 Tax=Musa troglodytarum TaxID=320322 RepID=A0A9E7FTT2_9LILI|nr:hypothetical protein MUK42_20187 [Musa troglodytarum]URE00842.1 hypothetical protein MUK42_20187 [Musa troglodytarum]